MPGINIPFHVPGLNQAINQMVRLNLQSQKFVSTSARISSGPAANYARAVSRFHVAQAGGGPVQQFDAAARLRQAQQALDRAQRGAHGASLTDRVTSLVRSTRIGSGGVMPLAGKLMDVAGVSGKAGLAITALVAAVASATLAVRVFADVLKAGYAELHESSTARVLSGGTAGNIAGLQAMGIGAGAIPGLAGGLRGALAQGGMAAGLGQQLGLGPTLPRLLANLNEAELLQKVVEQIAGKPGEGERRRFAQGLGLESVLPQIETYRRNASSARGDAAARGGIADAGTMKAVDDLFFSIDRLKFNFISLAQAIGKPVIQEATFAINLFADGIRELAAFLNANPQMIRALTDPVIRFVELIGRLAEAFGRLPHGTVDKIEKMFAAHVKATAAQNASNNQFAQSVNQFGAYVAAGTYGGGQRARGASPTGIGNAWAFDQAAVGQSLRAGAFSL